MLYWWTKLCWARVKKRRSLVIASAVVCGACGYFMSPKVYATTVLFYEKPDALYIKSFGTTRLDEANQQAQPAPLAPRIAREVARHLDRAAAALVKTNMGLLNRLDKFLEQPSD